MKKYLRKILNILFIRNEAIEYIEKDTKRNAKKTYKIVKNICIYKWVSQSHNFR